MQLRLSLLATVLVLACCQPPIPEHEVEVHVKGGMVPQGMFSIEKNGEVLSEHNTILPRFRDSTLNLISGGLMGRVRVIASIHEMFSAQIVKWDTIFDTVKYWSGGYDTTWYVTWYGGYWTGWDVDSIFRWYLLPYSTTLSEAYAVIYDTLGMVQGDSVTWYWTLSEANKP